MTKSVKQTIKDIKTLKIQGAESVAREAVKSIKNLALKAKTADKLLKDLEKARKGLITARPTEPFLRNCIHLIFYKLPDKNQELRKIKEEIIARANYILLFMERSKKIIVEIGSRKILKNQIVFTHCHSSTVTDILLNARKQGKKFEVHNTETRPIYQGRKTAKELAKKGIKVTHYVDSAARLALKRADIMLIGCDAITTEGKVINKIGTELFAEAANKQGTPVYVCTNSWKFDPKTIFGFEEKIEKRNRKEVWPNCPKNIKIDNFAFEKVNPELVTGIISEMGIFRPAAFIEEMRRAYKWMFKK